MKKKLNKKEIKSNIISHLYSFVFLNDGQVCEWDTRHLTPEDAREFYETQVCAGDPSMSFLGYKKYPANIIVA
jgi:hypothetical protein